MFQTRREALSWAAGFFDGEGCFYEHKNTARKDGTCSIAFKANVAQKDTSLLYRFQEVVGFGSIGKPDKTGTSRWTTTKLGEAEELLSLLGEWLSDRRVERAKEILVKEANQDRRRINNQWVHAQVNAGESEMLIEDCAGGACPIR